MRFRGRGALAAAARAARSWSARAFTSVAASFGGTLELARLHAPSVEAFVEWRRDNPGEPLVIGGALEDWALRDWGPERLRELDVEVPLEMSRGGGDYRDAFRDDLGTYAERELGARAFVAGHPARLRDFVDAFLLRDRDAPPRHLTAYLAQHDLLARVPELAEACADTPPYVGRGDPRDAAAAAAPPNPDRRVWLGPSGTVTPLHRDPYHNLLCQAWGEKRVLMFRAQDSDAMYPFPGGFLRNASRVDAEAPDLDAHPAFATAPRWETSLRPGEMLFMPARLWHHVRAETASLSVSHWWGRG